MRTLLQIIFCGLICLGFASNNQSDNKLNGQWTYCDGYTFKYLKLESSGAFQYIFDSCKGDTEIKGTFTQKGDTLVLIGNDRQFLIKDREIYSFRTDTGEFTEFQSLKKTNAKNASSAYDKCNKKRKKRR